MISDFRNGPGSKTGNGRYMTKVVEMRMFREHLRNNRYVWTTVKNMKAVVGIM